MMQSGATEYSKSTLRAVAQSSVLVILGLLITRGTNVLLRIVLGRTLGPQDLGIVSTIWSLVTMLGVITIVGIPPTVTRFLALYTHEERLASARALLLDTLVWILIISGGLAGLATLFAPLIALKLLNDPGTTSLVRVGVLAIPAWALMFWLVAVFRGMGQTAPSIFTRDISRAVLALGSLGILWWSHTLNVTTAVQFLYVIPTIVACGVGLALVWVCCKHIFTMPEHRAERGRWFRFAWPLSLSMFLQSTAGRSMDILVLGYLASTTEVGLYVSALSLVGLLGLIFQGVNYLALPLFTRSTGSSRPEDLQQTRLLTFGPTLPLALALILWPGLLTRITFGAAFSGAVLSIPILALGYVVSNFLGPVGQMLLAEGRTRWHLLADVVSVVSFLLLALILIPFLGVIGAAIARSGSQIAANVTAAFPFGREAIRMPPRLVSALLGVLCIVGIFRIITALMPGDTLTTVALLFIALLTSYAWLLVRFREGMISLWRKE